MWDQRGWPYKSLLTLERVIDYLLLLIARILKLLVFKKKASRKYVLIKCLGGVGDYVLLTASLPGYRMVFAGMKIVLMIRKGVEDFAKRNIYIDEVISVNYERMRVNIFEKLRVWYRVIHFDFDTVINADYSNAYELHDNNIIQWSMAQRKIAFKCLDDGSNRNYSIYDEIVPQKEQWMFEVERNNEMVHYLGLESYDNKTTYICGLDKYESSNEDVRNVLELRYYVIFPGSLRPKKCWPPDKFALIINGLLDLGYTPVICGSKKEQEIVNAVQRCSSANVINLIGKSNLMDLSLVIRGAKFLVSNDTSAVHIAACLGTTSFVILGGGHYGRFLPYLDKDFIVPIINNSFLECFNCYWQCRYEYYKCIQDTTVKDVLSVIINNMS